MRQTTLLLAFALLSLGCGPGPTRTVLPDPLIPHQLSRNIRLPILARQPDGTFVEQWVDGHAGDWYATPAALAGH